MKRAALGLVAFAWTASAHAETPLARQQVDITRASVDASIGFGLGSRHLSYHQALTSNLRPYDLDGAPMLTVALAAYPLAEQRVLRDIGFCLDYASALGLTSATRSGTQISSAWSRFDVGARYRARAGNGPEPAMFGVFAGYGVEQFLFTEANALAAELPAAAYGFARAAADMRAPVGPVALTASVGYLHVVSNGDVGLRVRGTSNDGVEASAGVSLPFAGNFEARLSAIYTRFFYSFAPAAGDAFVAGGALDQLFKGQLALAWVH
jgi:hypothetical protein